MVYDVTTYNGEEELFEIRYNILKDYVDRFIVVQFDQTFSGKPKTEFTQFQFPKVDTYINTEKTWGKYIDLAKSNPNTEYGKGAEHWIREFCQKESIKDCLTDLKDEDVVFIGDCDEVWKPRPKDLLEISYGPYKLKLRVYSYWLNNHSNEQFWGPIHCKYGQIKDKCLNEIRTHSDKSEHEYGWHFTSMGGYEKVKKKLEDSYTKETYASDTVIDNLKNNLDNNRDFLGRNFEYKIDESKWPQYLKENKEKYKHLCR